MNTIELTTMCALIRHGRILMIERNKSWKGWAFPGGHLEPGESLSDCVIREMFEETGVQILQLHYKGITNIFQTSSGKRHIITNFTANDFTGTVKEFCNEGRINWVDIEHIKRLQMAEGMEYRLPLFLKDGIQELYIEWDEINGYTKIEYRIF